MLEQIKRLGSDTAVYGLSTIVGRFLSFLLVPFYTNVLAPGDYGVVAYVYSLIAFVNVLYAYGMESAYFKYASSLERGTPEENFSTPFWSVVGSSIVLSLAIAAGVGVLFVGGDIESECASSMRGYWRILGRCVNINETLYLSTVARAGGLMLGAAFAMVWRPFAIMRSPMARRALAVDLVALAATGRRDPVVVRFFEAAARAARAWFFASAHDLSSWPMHQTIAGPT